MKYSAIIILRQKMSTVGHKTGQSEEPLQAVGYGSSI